MSRASATAFARFLLLGAGNTLATYALLLALAAVLPLSVAYTLAFGAGLVLTTSLSQRYVFRSRAGRAAVARFVGGYLLVYGVGQAVLQSAQSRADLPDWSLAAVVLLVTAPLSFLVGRATLGTPRATAPGLPLPADPSLQEGPRT